MINSTSINRPSRAVKINEWNTQQRHNWPNKLNIIRNNNVYCQNMKKKKNIKNPQRRASIIRYENLTVLMFSHSGSGWSRFIGKLRWYSWWRHHSITVVISRLDNNGFAVHDRKIAGRIACAIAIIARWWSPGVRHFLRWWITGTVHVVALTAKPNKN